MKKKLMLCLMALSILFSLVGCTSEPSQEAEAEADAEEIYDMLTDKIEKIGYSNGVSIWHDSVTDVLYIGRDSSRGAAMTPMLLPDGRPATLEEYIEMVNGKEIDPKPHAEKLEKEESDLNQDLEYIQDVPEKEVHYIQDAPKKEVHYIQDISQNEQN